MTLDEKKRIYSVLTAPFPEEAIERTDGRVTGRGYSTTGIKYQYIANRLNDVLGIGGWRARRTVTVKSVTTSKGREAFEAICDITLELGDWIDGQFIAWAESLAEGGHTAMSEADARKGAYTNAFKKAAAFFACGRQAYEGSLGDDSVPVEGVDFAPTPTLPRQHQAAPILAPTNGAVRPLGPDRRRWRLDELRAPRAPDLRTHLEVTSLYVSM